MRGSASVPRPTSGTVFRGFLSQFLGHSITEFVAQHQRNLFRPAAKTDPLRDLLLSQYLSRLIESERRLS